MLSYYQEGSKDGGRDNEFSYSIRDDPMSSSMKDVEGNLLVKSPPQSQHGTNDNEL